MTISDDLAKLEELRTRGTLTEEEFARAKARLLSGEAARTPTTPFVATVNSFRRSRSDRWIGGVCGGLARITGLESWAWRLIFTLFVLCAGTGLLAYILLLIFVPSE
jgi:phage shock protein PspC (stress-responsive transcriptional regulator)